MNMPGVARCEAWLLAFTAAVAAISGSLPVAALTANPRNPSETLRFLFVGEWSTVGHLLVFFVIFFGLLVKPLKDRLDRAGVAVAVGLALMLSASLALTGRFHLLDLEPLAGVGLFVLAGASVGLAFHRLYSASWATTGALSFVAGYGSMRLVAPGLLPIAEEFFIVPSLLYTVAIVWLVYSFGAQAFPSGGSGTTWLTHASHTLAARPPQARQRVKETMEAQTVLGDVAQQELQDHAVVLAEIDETRNALKTYSSDEPEMRTVVAARLEQLSGAQRKVDDEMRRYRALVERIEFLDLSECSDLQHTLDALPGDVQAEARLELHDLRKKLGSDEILKRLGQGVAANNAAVTDALERAKKALSAGQVKVCQQALNDARTAEAEAVRLTAQVKRFSDQLKGAAAKVVMQADTRAAELVLGK
jgi:hypothetical protein